MTRALTRDDSPSVPASNIFPGRSGHLEVIPFRLDPTRKNIVLSSYLTVTISIITIFTPRMIKYG